MQPNLLISSIVVTSNLVSSPTFASCAITPESSETIVRGRFVRCEDAGPYLESGGAYRAYEQDLETELARRSPESAARLLEILEDSLMSPEFEARVAVVAVESYVFIVPWVTGDEVEFKDRPREFRDTIRYWWRGSIEQCESIPEYSSISLWIRSECCDTPTFGSPVCIIGMNYAEPPPDGMDEAAAEVFSAL